jgi:hypothetical protein
VRASLDVSVPMIGAPEAWAAGYDGTGVKVAILDTGIDETHPDLAGKVVASKSFVDGETVKDGFGHGTHVASTIAGSGAASGGKYKGVAPGAELVIGKVLGDSGSGTESWVIDGMEWATTTAGARIVSMSLGSGAPSDGTDPMSQAVNDLTASTGALFVIAAGNEGPAPNTISAPGAADAALTVAAVDKSDQLAEFSNRGPRTRYYALKPDIAAPGVRITAARAAGTAMDTPVDDYYTTASGTSMATPHVAGAAAILAQEHPDWTGEQIKAALTSTSRDDGYTVYEQGAGRVDVAAASRAAVVAGTVKVDFGRFRFPQTGPAVSRTVTYRNTGSTPVTLNLAATLEDPSGNAAPAGMLTVAPSTLDILAGATADATVTLDPTLGPIGTYSGTITATADGVTLRTPVGAYKEPKGFDLTVDTVLPDRAVDAFAGTVVVKRVDRDTGQWILLGRGTSNFAHLDEGVYSVSQAAYWNDAGGDLNNVTLMVNPEVSLHQDTTVTLDANTARLSTPGTADRPTDPYATTAGIWRIPAGSTTPYGLLTGQLPYLTRLWVTPTGTATVGTFLFEHRYVLGTPLVTASVARHGRFPGFTLHPRYQSYTTFVTKLSGQVDLPVVDAGTGSAEDFAKVDARGKVALIDVGDKSLIGLLGLDYAGEELDNAARAGAKAVFAYGNSGWPILGSDPVPVPNYYPLPVIALRSDEGVALRDRVARGPATLRIGTQPSIPDVYALSYLEQDSVPASVHHTVRDGELATLRPTFHADRTTAIEQQWGTQHPTIFKPDLVSEGFMGITLFDIQAPFARTEHVGPVSDSALWFRSIAAYDLDRVLRSEEFLPLKAIQVFLGSMSSVEVFDRPIARDETWAQPPTVPGVPTISDTAGALWGQDGAECAVCRFSGLLPDGDILPILTVTTDEAGRFNQLTTWANKSLNPERSGVDEWHLYRDGTELPQQSLAGEPNLLPFYVLPHGSATYRMTEHFEDWQPHGGFGYRADTAWTFTSADPTGNELPATYDSLGLCVDRCRVEPLLFLRYQFDLGLDNRLPAPGSHTFTVTAYRQPSKGAAMPPVAGMKVSASVDGGRTWTRVPVKALGGGKYSVTLAHPRLGSPTGTVSLRTEAWDTAGNRVEQTIPDAYGLVARH